MVPIVIEGHKFHASSTLSLNRHVLDLQQYNTVALRYVYTLQCSRTAYLYCGIYLCVLLLSHIGLVRAPRRIIVFCQLINIVRNK